jgi:hydroxyacyl-ACP dehydratase HTD2-like protein with hotdog domain
VSKREAAFSHTLIPTPALLFRFSALTFNAHAIHLDPSYCREVEAHRNLLVHGPLSLLLLMTMLRARIAEQGPDTTIKSFQYRNIAPIYANEAMKLCGRESSTNQNEVELWVENSEGVQAVRGTATLHR